MLMHVRKFFTWCKNLVVKKNDITFPLDISEFLDDVTLNSKGEIQNPNKPDLKWLVREELKQVSEKRILEDLNEEDRKRFERACASYYNDTELQWVIEVVLNTQQRITLTQAQTEQDLFNGRVSATAILGFKNMLYKHAVAYEQKREAAQYQTQSNY